MNRKEPSLFGAQSAEENQKHTQDEQITQENSNLEKSTKLEDDLSNSDFAKKEQESEKATGAYARSSEDEDLQNSQKNQKNQNSQDEKTQNEQKTRDEKNTDAEFFGSQRSFIELDKKNKSKNPFGDNLETKDPFEFASISEYSATKKQGNTGVFLLTIFLALAFAGLISLGFWQWGTIQNNNKHIEKLTKTLDQIASDLSFIDESGDKKATSLQDSLNKLNKSVAYLGSLSKKQKSASDKNSARISNLDKSLSKTNSEIKSLSKNISSVKNALDSSINGLNAQVAALKNTDASLAKQIKGVANNLGELSVTTDALANKLNKINMKDIQDLKSARSQIEQQIRSLTITTKRLTRQVEALLKAKK